MPKIRKDRVVSLSVSGLSHLARTFPNPLPISNQGPKFYVIIHLLFIIVLPSILEIYCYSKTTIELSGIKVIIFIFLPILQAGLCSKNSPVPHRASAGAAHLGPFGSMFFHDVFTGWLLELGWGLGLLTAWCLSSQERKLHRSCVNFGHLASKVIYHLLVEAATKSHLVQGAGSLPAPVDWRVGRFWKNRWDQKYPCRLFGEVPPTGLSM